MCVQFLLRTVINSFLVEPSQQYFVVTFTQCLSVCACMSMSHNLSLSLSLYPSLCLRDQRNWSDPFRDREIESMKFEQFRIFWNELHLKCVLILLNKFISLKIIQFIINIKPLRIIFPPPQQSKENKRLPDAGTQCCSTVYINYN